MTDVFYRKRKVDDVTHFSMTLHDPTVYVNGEVVAAHCELRRDPRYRWLPNWLFSRFGFYWGEWYNVVVLSTVPNANTQVSATWSIGDNHVQP